MIEYFNNAYIFLHIKEVIFICKSMEHQTVWYLEAESKIVFYFSIIILWSYCCPIKIFARIVDNTSLKHNAIHLGEIDQRQLQISTTFVWKGVIRKIALYPRRISFPLYLKMICMLNGLIFFWNKSNNNNWQNLY